MSQTLRPAPPHTRPTPVWSVPLGGSVHPVAWLGLAGLVFTADLLSGPYVQVAILFVVPVALATWSQGRKWGSAVALALPLARLAAFYTVWHVPSSWWLKLLDATVDVLVLLALVQVIHYVARQRRELNVLEGMLPICGFCKRIRDEAGGWRQWESYITERSEARFSHTFCPECGRAHYGELAEE